MQQGRVDAVVVGCDRVAANGDVANKIGTYTIAVLAKRHGIPFYVAGPTSSIDLNCPSGKDIPIEQRDAKEVSHIFGKALAPKGMRVLNPAFDVTVAGSDHGDHYGKGSDPSSLSAKYSQPCQSLRKSDELEAYFHDAGKPRERWRVGTEYEKVGIDRDTGQAIPYFGPRGVDFILRELIERFGWEPEEQDGNIIALSRDKAQITLEPGGQIELSGEPCESIHCTYAEFDQHIRELLEVTRAARHRFSRTGHAAGKPLGRDRVGAEATLSHHGAVHAQSRHARPAHDEADRHGASQY